MDTRESLARELAEERMENAIEIAQEGGVSYKDITIDIFMSDALAFVDRCINLYDPTHQPFDS